MNEELKDLRAEVLRLGAHLGAVPRESETAVEFARRCIVAAARLRKAAGVTWSDYELIRLDKNRAWFALKKPPEHSPLGGPRWPVDVGQGLEELAVKLGTYEGA